MRRYRSISGEIRFDVGGSPTVSAGQSTPLSSQDRLTPRVCGHFFRKRGVDDRPSRINRSERHPRKTSTPRRYDTARLAWKSPKSARRHYGCRPRRSTLRPACPAERVETAPTSARNGLSRTFGGVTAAFEPCIDRERTASRSRAGGVVPVLRASPTTARTFTPFSLLDVLQLFVTLCSTNQR